jgi:holo-[acyl-carrier protein] synthase
MIVGIGIDVCPVERFSSVSDRTSSILDKLFTESEQVTPSGTPRTAASLAARFAAKEALSKALGAPGGMAWHDAEVTVGEHGAPSLVVRGTVKARADELGVKRWHVSLSHDGGLATAIVIAEG